MRNQRFPGRAGTAEFAPLACADVTAIAILFVVESIVSNNRLGAYIGWLGGASAFRPMYAGMKMSILGVELYEGSACSNGTSSAGRTRRARPHSRPTIAMVDVSLPSGA